MHPAGWLTTNDRPTAIHGVAIRPLVAHADDRGTFTEIFRESWLPEPRLVQWNAVKSRAGTLRGVHAHRVHADYLVLLTGHLWLGLVDLRRNADPEHSRALVAIDATAPMAVVIPPGVAHGFLFSVDSLHIYAVSHYHSTADELGCRWDDPGLGLEWPTTPCHVSPRDQQLPDLTTLRASLFAGSGV